MATAASYITGGWIGYGERSGEVFHEWSGRHGRVIFRSIP